MFDDWDYDEMEPLTVQDIASFGGDTVSRPPEAERCPRCHGWGALQNGYEDGVPFVEDCNVCGGSGRKTCSN